MIWEEWVLVDALGMASVLETGLRQSQKEARPISREFSLCMNIDGNAVLKQSAKTTVNPSPQLKCCYQHFLLCTHQPPKNHLTQTPPMHCHQYSNTRLWWQIVFVLQHYHAALKCSRSSDTNRRCFWEEWALWCILAAVLCSKLIVIPGTNCAVRLKTSCFHQEVRKKKSQLWDKETLKNSSSQVNLHNRMLTNMNGCMTWVREYQPINVFVNKERRSDSCWILVKTWDVEYVVILNTEKCGPNREHT